MFNPVKEMVVSQHFYEPDDGPLSCEALDAIDADVADRLPSGPVLERFTLF